MLGTGAADGVVAIADDLRADEPRRGRGIFGMDRDCRIVK
jgi:hypothetical protein